MNIYIGSAFVTLLTVLAGSLLTSVSMLVAVPVIRYFNEYARKDPNLFKQVIQVIVDLVSIAIILLFSIAGCGFAYKFSSAVFKTSEIIAMRGVRFLLLSFAIILGAMFYFRLTRKSKKGDGGRA